MLSTKNLRLAGYIVTGNLSRFLETDDNLAWPQHCPLVQSPIHTMNQCYDRILILYEGEIKFVDTIKRQTHSTASVQKCTDPIKNSFNGMDQEDLWYRLTPGIVHQDRLAVFGPKNVSPVTINSFPGSQDAGMYTKTELSNFWDSILISAASRNDFKKALPETYSIFQQQEGPGSVHFYALRTDFFVDNMISRGYFKEQIKDTTGPFVYVLEHCAIYPEVIFSEAQCTRCGNGNTPLGNG